MANNKRESLNHFSNIATIIGIIYTIITILQIIEKPIFKIQEIESTQEGQAKEILDIKAELKTIRQYITNSQPKRIYPLGE